MTPEERAQTIRDLDNVEKAIGIANDQIEYLTARERNGAILAYPGDFRDDELSQAKQRAVAQAARLVKLATDIHEKLVGG